MTASPALHSVLSQYPDLGPQQQISACHDAGGFSGCQIWRVSTPCGEYCLRRWPAPHPDGAQLAWIHAVLQRAGNAGLTFIPVPIATSAGTTFLHHRGTFWEVTPWQPGLADFHARPTPARLHAAMQALAQFHLAVCDAPAQAPSPGLQHRLHLMRQWQQGGFGQASRALDSLDWPGFCVPARQILQHAIRQAPTVTTQLQIAAALAVHLQPVIRDVWHDHILFQDERVTGIVDFGAMRVDTVAGDLARLLGSMVGEQRSLWQEGLAAYQQLRPLSQQETALISAFDFSGMVISGLNWIQWVAMEGRTFACPERVVQRLEQILARLVEFAR